MVLSNRHNFSPFIKIVVAEHDGEGSFKTGSRINAISAHAYQRNRQNIAKMYSDRRVIPLLQEIGVTKANGEVRFATGSSYIGVFAHAQ